MDGDTIEELARRLAKTGCWIDKSYGRDFAGLLSLMLPRIVRLIRQYRLMDMRDDAEQVSAIGVHRALQSFNPSKARFTTHATWQIKGELKSLRHRMRLDQRAGARNAGIATVSIEELGDGSNAFGVAEIADELALPCTERGASDVMARSVISGLFDRIGAPPDEQMIVLAQLFDHNAASKAHSDRTPEQRRQVIRRTYRNCIKVLAA